MARKLRHGCSRCEQKIVEGHAFCKSCGYPTQWASHDEKVEWELQQYEEARVNGAHADFDRLQAAPPPVIRRSARRVTPTGPSEPEPVISVRDFREQRAGDVAVVRTPEPRRHQREAKPLPPVPEPSEAAVLVKVMRLLNARISELEARLAELEGERAPSRRASER